MSRPRLKHLPALDGLRGAAVAAVLLFHGGHLEGGYLGVDLFFVLSGFLITSLLLAEAGDRGHVGLARFWERRARRLLPALGVTVVGVGLYARFAADPTELHTIRLDGLATLFYVANWRAVFAHVDYWALFSTPSPFEHTWSLAIEEQFYVLWPLVFVGLLALHRRRRPDGDRASLANLVLATALGAGAVSGAISLWFGSRNEKNRVYFGTDTRALAILAGIAVAALAARRGDRETDRARWLALQAAALGAVGLLAAAWTHLGGQLTLYHGGLVACSVAGAVVIAAAAHPRPGPVTVAASVPPLRWLGLISYGLYLYHWPLFVWLSPVRTGLDGWTLFGVRIAVTLVVAIVSYRFVEQPIRRGSGWPRRVNVAVPAAGLVLATAVLLGSTVGAQQLPVGYQLQAAAVQVADRQAHDTGARRLMIIGNSVAFFLGSDGFSKVRSRPPLVSVNAAAIACVYPTATRAMHANDHSIVTFDHPRCDEGWDYAVDRFRPEWVLFTRNGTSQDLLDHGGTWIAPCDAGYRPWVTATLTADAARLTRHGATLVVVTSAYSDPRFGEDPSLRPDYVRSVDCGNDVLRAIARAHPRTMRLVDLNRYLCRPDGGCTRTIDGTYLRTDGTHFRGRGALIIADWIARQLGIDVTGP